MHSSESRQLRITEHSQLRALGNPVRAQILGLLEEAPTSAKQLAAKLEMTHGKVGYHLKVLAEAGLIEVAEERRVRAVVERFFRPTFDRLHIDLEGGGAGDPLKFMLRQAALEARPHSEQPFAPLGRIYSTRMHPARAQEFARRLVELADEFGEAGSSGIAFGFVGAVYEIDLPR